MLLFPVRTHACVKLVLYPFLSSWMPVTPPEGRTIAYLLIRLARLPVASTDLRFLLKFIAIGNKISSLRILNKKKRN